MAVRTRKGEDPLAFGPVMTWEQIKKAEEGWNTTRLIALAALTRSGHEIAEGAWKDGDAFLDVLQQAIDYQKHAMAALKVAESAVARLITVGETLSSGRYNHV